MPPSNAVVNSWTLIRGPFVCSIVSWFVVFAICSTCDGDSAFVNQSDVDD